MSIKKIQCKLPVTYIEDGACEEAKNKNFFLKKVIRKSIFGDIKEKIEKNQWREDDSLKIDSLLNSYEDIKKNEKKYWMDIIWKNVLHTFLTITLWLSMFSNFESIVNNETYMFFQILYFLLLIFIGIACNCFLGFLAEGLSNYFSKKKEISLYLEDNEYVQKSWFKKLFTRKYKKVNFLCFGLSNLVFKNKRFKELWISQYALIYDSEGVKVPLETKGNKKVAPNVQKFGEFLKEKISSVSID